MSASRVWLSLVLAGALSALVGCGDAATDPVPAPGISQDAGAEAACDTCGADAGSSDSDSDAAPPVPVRLVAGFFNVRDRGAKGDGTTDDTAAVRQTIVDADAAGGGIVLFPAGRYRITGGLDVGAGVTLAGQGYTPPVSGIGGVPGALAGTWLMVDATLLGKSLVTLAGGGATIRDLGIWHDQPAPGPGFVPRAYGWAIDMVMPDTLVRGVWLENATLGVRGIGRTTIENVQGQPISTGIRIDGAYDVVRIRHVRFGWTGEGRPVWSSDPSVKSRLGVAIESFRNDNPEIYDVKVAGYATGVHYGASAAGVTSKFSMMDTTIDDAAHGVTIDGASTTGKLTRLWETRCGTGIWITGAGSVVSAADVDVRTVTTNAVRVESASAFFVVNQLTVVDFDQAKVGFPALEAADANATVKVGLFRAVSGGAVPFGGVGHLLVDSNPASAVFDLRMPTPTEVPEDGLVPYAATIDVLAYGARGDGTGDDAPAIQKALAAAAAAGGGAVVVPAGDYHLKGGLKIPAGVALIGVGWQGQATAKQIDAATGVSAPGRVFKGAYLSIDGSSTSDAIELADRASVQMLGFRWDQGVVAPGWQPRPFGWAVRVTGTSARVRDLFLLNPTKGIEVASTGTGAVLVDHVFGSPLGVGLRLDTSAAVRANDLHFWPFWGLGGAYGDVVAPRVEASAVAFESARSVHAEVSNAFSILYATGVLLAQSAGGQVSEDFRLWNTDQDVGGRGFVVSGPGTTATFANWSAQGDTSATSPGVTGLWVTPAATNAHVSGYNGDLRLFTGNAVRSDAPGADVRVNLMRLEGWGRGGPFPPVEGAAAGPEAWTNGS